MRRYLWPFLFVLSVSAVVVSAQPFSAQIQAAQRTFRAENQTITGVWTFATPPSGAVAWGGITGTLANQADLASALAAKAPAPPQGTTASIGGSALVAGACATGTVTVTGATTAMAAFATPISADPTNGAILGVSVLAKVTSANTVTVSVCVPIIGTPTASTYRVVVMP